MRAIKNFDIILFASPCLFCLLTFHEASVKKNRGNHWLHFDAKAVCDTAYSSQIDLFLDFWWSCSKQLEEDFSWIFSKKLNEICNVLSCMSHCVLLFFIFSWLFMKLQQKNRKKPLMAFQCQDCDTKFSYQIDYFWLFMKLQQKTWRNIHLHFNAKTVIQHFLPTLILFLTFHEDSVKESGRNLLLESSFLGGPQNGKADPVFPIVPA